MSYDAEERLSTESLVNASPTPAAFEQETIGYDLESEPVSLSDSCAGTNTACTVGAIYGTAAPSFVSGQSYTSSGDLMSTSLGSVQGNSASGGLPSPAPSGPVPTATYAYTMNADVQQVTDLLSTGNLGINPAYDFGHQLDSYAVDNPAKNNVQAITYDTDHNVSSWQTSANGNPTTTYAHDDFGRLTSMQGPPAGTWSYTYDPDGNVLTTTDPNGAVTTETYDALNRPLTSKSVKSGATESTSWTYDSTTSGAYGIGRLATMTDPSGSSTYSYEPRGHIVSYQQTVNGHAYTTAYTYDVDDDLATETMPSGRVLTYAYDSAHRPISVTGVLSGVTTHYVTGAQYLPFGPLTQLTYGNGVVQTWTFNERYLPYRDRIVKGSTTLSDVAYAEDNLGQFTQIDDLLASQYDRAFTYGSSHLPENQLAASSTGSALWSTASFDRAYFQAEDLGTEDIGTANNTLNYDSNDHLSSVVVNGTTNTVTEDAAGNQTLYNTKAYSYSPRNLLASGEGITYAYNGFGRRVTASSSAGLQASLYDAFGDLSSESSPSSASINYDYIWFDGKPVAQETLGGSPSTSYTHTNELGAPFLQTSASGTATWQADYGLFGNIYDLRIGAATTHQPLRLPGQEAVMLPGFTGSGGSSQLLYNQARWYAPTIGRYMAPDQLGYATDPFDQYAYVGDNPINLIDPYGLDAAQNARNLFGGIIEGQYPWFYHSAEDYVDDREGGWYGTGNMIGFTATTGGIGPLARIGSYGLRFAGARLAPYVAADFARFSSLMADESGGNCPETGTVWDSVTATQENYAGSVVPKSMILSTSSGDFWIHPNATEHMYEYAKGSFGSKSQSIIDLGTQMQISNLKSAIEQATVGGIPENRTAVVNGLQLSFGTPRGTGQLPVIFHAFEYGEW